MNHLRNGSIAVGAPGSPARIAAVLRLPPVPQGMERGWYTCRECGRVLWHDFVPYALSAGIITLPCGHGMGQHPTNAMKSVTKSAALTKLHKQYKQVIQQRRKP